MYRWAVCGTKEHFSMCLSLCGSTVSPLLAFVHYLILIVSRHLPLPGYILTANVSSFIFITSQEIKCKIFQPRKSKIVFTIREIPDLKITKGVLSNSSFQTA